MTSEWMMEIENCVNEHGEDVRTWVEVLKDWEFYASLMDDEIREELHAKLAPCTKAEFWEAYKAAHLAKYGEEFQYI